MQVFKFGGSAIKDADGIRKLAEIVKSRDEGRILVVSALGNTTNALEDLFACYFDGNDDWKERLNRIRQFHLNIAAILFGENDNLIKSELEHSFSNLSGRLKKKPEKNYDRQYDQIVSEGEIWSTRIVKVETAFCTIRPILRCRSRLCWARLGFRCLKRTFFTEGLSLGEVSGLLGFTRRLTSPICRIWS